jgi:hypothetical protein
VVVEVVVVEVVAGGADVVVTMGAVDVVVSTTGCTTPKGKRAPTG